MKPTKFLFILLGVLFLGAGTFIPFYLAEDEKGLGWWGETFPFASFGLTVVVMLLGIIFGCLFRRVARRNDKILLGKELREVFSSPSFIAALCVSPLIFMSAYVVVSKSPGDPSSYLLAFQNGFFCEAIFQQLYKGYLEKTPGDPGNTNPSTRVS